MSRQLFKNSFSGFDGAKQKRTAKSFEDKFPSAMRKLRAAIVEIDGMAANLAKRKEAGLSKHFILHEKTLKTEAKSWFPLFEE